MYPLVLAIHNIFRWVVVILIVAALVRAYLGWLEKRGWTEADRKAGSFTAMAIDIQLLLGLVLYFFLSPVTGSLVQNFGAGIQEAEPRFFGIEHAVLMVMGVIFAHLGNVLPRKVSDALSKHKRAALAFSLAALMIAAGMPWARPLLPGLH